MPKLELRAQARPAEPPPGLPQRLRAIVQPLKVFLEGQARLLEASPPQPPAFDKRFRDCVNCAVERAPFAADTGYSRRLIAVAVVGLAMSTGIAWPPCASSGLSADTSPPKGIRTVVAPMSAVKPLGQAPSGSRYSNAEHLPGMPARTVRSLQDRVEPAAIRLHAHPERRRTLWHAGSRHWYSGTRGQRSTIVSPRQFHDADGAAR